MYFCSSSAKGFKQNAVSSGSGNVTLYCNKVFGAWDYCISEPKTADLKHSNILQDIMVRFPEFKQKIKGRIWEVYGGCRYKILFYKQAHKVGSVEHFYYSL